MSRIIIEFQGFNLKSKFCFKEVTVSEIGSKVFTHFFIKSFKNFCDLSLQDRKVVQYCERNLHRIYWSAGSQSFKQVHDYVNQLLKEGAVVYTKGAEKVKILEKSFKISGPILNLDDLWMDLDFQGYNSDVERCPLPFHKNVSSCSHLKAQTFAKLLEAYDESLHEQKSSFSEEDIQMSSTETEDTH